MGQLAGGEVRILTLTGPGGVGKTRVAIEAATEFAEHTGIPAVFVPLASITDASLLPAAVARTLQLTGSSSSPDTRVIQALASMTILLVLDNFEHLLDAAPFIARISDGAPGVTQLITSRSRLRMSQERELRVAPLALPDRGAKSGEIAGSGAVRLFIVRGTSSVGDPVSVHRDLETAAEICRRLDGLPLAIELAASRLRLMSPGTLLEMLEMRLPVLTGGPRDQPARQQSMRDAIGWSYDLLEPRGQKLFRWLAVYAGGFSSHAVSHTGIAAGLEAVACFDVLDELLDGGLVHRVNEAGGEPRFRMLETIREYGLEQLAARGEVDDAWMEYARFMFEYVADGAPIPVGPIVDTVWYDRLSIEHDNIVAAFDWLCLQGHASLAVRFCAEIGAYWEFRGPYRDYAVRMQRALSLAPLVADTDTLSALYWAAGLSMYAGDFDIAKAYGLESLRLAREIGDVRAEVISLGCLGWNAELAGDWPEAANLFEQSLAGWRSLGELIPQGNTLMLLGGHAYIRGEYAKARELEEQAAAIFAGRTTNDWPASTEWYLGFIDVAEGKWHDAAVRFAHSLELWLTVSSRTHHFKPIIHLADVAAAIGDFETAATLAGCCDHLLESTGTVPFPFDVPARERAIARSREALGQERYNELVVAARSMESDDWLRLAQRVVERTNVAPASADAGAGQ